MSRKWCSRDNGREGWNPTADIVYNAHCSKMVDHSLHLKEIIDFPPKLPPLTYLGIPISGKRKGFGQCIGLIQPLEKILIRWKGRYLSHRGRFQLVNWVFAGIFTPYWINGTSLPSFVVTKIRQIVYKFIWDGRKSVPWSRMVLPEGIRRVRGKEF